MPKAFTYGAGVLIALMLILATAVTIVYVDKRHTAERHDNALQLAQVAFAESATTLDHIIAHEDLGCDNDHLMHLNGHLLRSRYIRAIGVLDVGNMLIYQPALGLMTPPVKDHYHISPLLYGPLTLQHVPFHI